MQKKNIPLYLFMTLSSADNPFKQFGPRSGQTLRVMTLVRVF